MKYREIQKILEAHGFSFKRQTSTHHFFEAVIDGQRRLVNLDYNGLGDDISPKNLQSIIRTSGLPKKTFRR